MAVGTASRAPAHRAAKPAPTPGRQPAAGRVWRWISDHAILFAGVLVLAYTFVPIGYIIALSFNQPSGRAASAQWNSFTTDNWTSICEPQGMCASLKLSFEVSITATIISTILGTLLAFGMARHYWRGRGAANILIFLPMATPEVVMGSSLLALFAQGGVNRGFVTLFIAHVLFCMSFVVVTVKARLQGMDPRLEQAAADLYATPYQTFRRVTLPLVLPGIVAAALLSFSLSFDDFIVTNFNSGNLVTFPMFVFGANQRGVPPQINVIGSIMFFLALFLVLAAQYRTKLRRRRA
jgi:spermidine/putrescine transport system permease protein